VSAQAYFHLKRGKAAPMYQFLDYALDGLHIALLLFNLFGWLSPWLRLHALMLAATAFSWLVLGYWYGWGYCVFTDWHWQVKHHLGQVDLPASYISYLLAKYLSLTPTPFVVNNATLGCFLASVGLSIYFNFFRHSK
jgi:hypothetical protein